MWTVCETAVGIWFDLFAAQPAWGALLAFVLPVLALVNLALAATHIEHWMGREAARGQAFGRRRHLSGSGITQRQP
ncbi:MAG: hypothetical protein FJX68_01230 [Alphaproteobacteria bacterium]|nr:hypothetical protein [Alphaproteobacteria bacterium]